MSYSFVKQFFCINWDDHVIFIFYFIYEAQHIDWFPLLNHACLPGINLTWVWCFCLFLPTTCHWHSASYFILSSESFHKPECGICTFQRGPVRERNHYLQNYLQNHWVYCICNWPNPQNTLWGRHYCPICIGRLRVPDVSTLPPGRSVWLQGRPLCPISGSPKTSRPCPVPHSCFVRGRLSIWAHAFSLIQGKCLFLSVNLLTHSRTLVGA